MTARVTDQLDHGIATLTMDDGKANAISLPKRAPGAAALQAARGGTISRALRLCTGRTTMDARARFCIPLLAVLLAWLPVASAADWNYRVGEDAPAFNLKTLDGKVLSSGDLRGHYVVVSFMTTWCPFCNASAPHLQKIADAYRDRDVRVLIVDIDEGQKTVRKFATKHGLTCPILMDDGGKVTTLYAPPKDFIPDLERQEVMIASFAIVDPEGKVRFLTLNEKPEEFDARLTKLRSRLDELLAAK